MGRPVAVMMGCGLHGQGSTPNRTRDVLLLIASRLAPGPNPEWLRGNLTYGVKPAVSEFEPTSPYITEAENGGSTPPLPYTPSRHCCYLITHRDK
jgi:hypothetical protein